MTDTTRTTRNPTARDGAGSTRAVDRALDLLIALTDGSSGRSLSELARAADLSPATASRLLSTLAQRGFVQRSERGDYQPGRQLKQMAAIVLREEPLYELAGPHLTALAEETGETANLGIALDADRVLYLRQVASPQRVQTAAWTGRTIPREGTAIGAALDGAVGAEGYVAMQRTVEPDVTAVAAPIVDHAAAIVGAISILAPTYRTDEERIATYGRLLVHHAREMSLALGAPDALAAPGGERPSQPPPTPR